MMSRTTLSREKVSFLGLGAESSTMGAVPATPVSRPITVLVLMKVGFCFDERACSKCTNNGPDIKAAVCHFNLIL